MSFILDSSVVLIWCFEDERTPATAALLDRVGETGAVAPQHWPLEALNGLMMAERRNRVDAEHRRRLARFLGDLPITLDNETSIQVWTATQELAEQHRLTVYDAATLELALRQNLPLASLDGPLRTVVGNRSMTLPLPRTTGGCLCGAIRYAYDGEPGPAYYCHCADCRRSTGSAFNIGVRIEARLFRLTQGTPKAFTKTGDSGNALMRHFCPECASPLWTSSPRHPEFYYLKAGCLDDPAAVRPTHQIWVKSRVP